jgi:enoyl-[acyl-carrier-protein] reductase (NADH)
LIVAPQLSSGRQNNYSTKTRQAGWANEQSMYSLMSMGQASSAKMMSHGGKLTTLAFHVTKKINKADELIYLDNIQKDF